MRISDWSSDVCSSDLPIAQRDRGAELPLVEMLDVERQAAKRRPVPASVFDQRLALGYPEVAAVATQPLVEDDACHLPPLAGARAIAKEKAGPIGVTGLCRRQRKTLLAGHELPGQTPLQRRHPADQRLDLTDREKAGKRE